MSREHDKPVVSKHAMKNLVGDILVVDDEIHNLQLLTQLLSEEGYQIRPAETPQLAIEAALAQPPCLILLDVRMPEMDGFEVCKHLKQDERTRDIPIIFISALQDVQSIAQGFEAGGVDYISKPYQEQEVLARVRTHMSLRQMQSHLEDLVAERTAELEAEIIVRKQAFDEIDELRNRLMDQNATLRQEVGELHSDEELVGKSHVFRAALYQVELVAATDSTVLLLGETGTGKSLIARRIHERSRRSDHPMVTVNCSALPATLIESELFGHEKGAFTGAINRKIGRFELASDGTIFLDEIGDLPTDLQAKLLRVLQDQEFERIGSSTTIKVDVRVIAATNRDLDQLMKQGEFRSDLYYRLGVFPIRLPPLREHRDDIPLLVWFFISELQHRLGKIFDEVSANAMETLTSYDWPGNVRELRNIIERAMILSPTSVLQLDDWFPGHRDSTGMALRPHAQQGETLEEVERAHMEKVLASCDWKIRGEGGAAERLGLKRTTLQSKMKKLGIERPKA